MDLGLLYEIDSSSAHQEALYEYWKDLRDAKTDVGEVCFGSLSSPGYIDFKQIQTLCDVLDVEGFGELEVVNPK
jgi:hypothetical protein